MVLPMAVLAFLALAIGVFPAGPVRLLVAPVSSIVGGPPVETARFIAQCGRISLVCLVFLGITLALAVIRRRLLRGRTIAPASTWGCGYHGVTTRMQYTGSSFADGILSLCGRIVQRERHLAKPQGVFPAGGDFKTHSRDLFDAYLLRPALDYLARVCRRFRWIQHGDLQNYLIYGLSFLVIIIAWH